MIVGGQKVPDDAFLSGYQKDLIAKELNGNNEITRIP